jgi:predicted ATP-grasp superfamily ATP-dependent carboligase
MRILITDGDSRAALAITRALGRRGHTVVVAEKNSRALAQASRFCTEAAVYPDPGVNERGFIDTMLTTVRAKDIHVLLPVADVTSSLIVEHRGMFEPGCMVPLASAEAIARAADKVELLKTAQRLEVPVPVTSYVDTPGAGNVLESVTYPVVVKPRRSRVRSASGWVGCSVSYAEHRQALLKRIASYPSEAFPLMLQERIDGPGCGVFMCYADDRPIAEFSHRRIREKPPTGGVSVLCESVQMSPDMRKHAQVLLDELRWRGVAMVEFKIDRKDGRPKLMEINGRFWGSLQLAIDAGVDFPHILIESFSGHAMGALPPYRVGVRSRWFWGDVDALLLQLFSRAGLAHPVSDRARAVGDFLKLWGPELHYDNPRRSDVRPWIRETKHWFQRIATSPSGRLLG